jgi:hypothetical protein
MSTLPMTPSALQAMIATDLINSAALKVRLDSLQDALDETRFPAVPQDHPSWNDPDTWAPCPAIAPGFAIVPLELDPADFDREYPFLVSATGDAA